MGIQEGFLRDRFRDLEAVMVYMIQDTGKRFQMKELEII